MLRDHLCTMLAPAIPSAPADQSSPFAVAGWIEGLVAGPAALAVATIALAWFGLSLLGGTISLRRGAMVVIGCFILFGAPSLARGLMGLAGNAQDASAAAPQASLVTPPPPAPPIPPSFDPYAGAAVPQGQ